MSWLRKRARREMRVWRAARRCSGERGQRLGGGVDDQQPGAQARFYAGIREYDALFVVRDDVLVAAVAREQRGAGEPRVDSAVGGDL